MNKKKRTQSLPVSHKRPFISPILAAEPEVITVRITTGRFWYKHLEGRVFDVCQDPYSVNHYLFAEDVRAGHYNTVGILKADTAVVEETDHEI